MGDGESGDRFQTEFAARVVASVMDFMPMGVFVIDAEAFVLAANRMAYDAVAENDGIRISEGRLMLAPDGECGALHKAISRTIGKVVAGSVAVEAFNVRRPSGKRPFHVLVTGLCAETDRRTSTRLGCVFLGHGASNMRPERRWLENFFGLTCTEARLASFLAGGSSLEETADAMGIGINTARTHLSRVLDKTGVSRQAELVRTILRGPAYLHTDTGRDADAAEAVSERIQHGGPG